MCLHMHGVQKDSVADQEQVFLFKHIFSWFLWRVDRTQYTSLRHRLDTNLKCEYFKSELSLEWAFHPPLQREWVLFHVVYRVASACFHTASYPNASNTAAWLVALCFTVRRCNHTFSIASQSAQLCSVKSEICLSSGLDGVLEWVIHQLLPQDSRVWLQRQKYQGWFR